MPSAQVVIAKDTLVVSDESKVCSVVFRIVEDIDERFSAQFDTDFEVIPLPLNNVEKCFGEIRGRFAPNSILK